ncbi:MAG: hypothetical protein HFJ29_04230 [Clostridia bacterium]|nr:hypothetical protein [Clostridia bacterium]
MEKKAYFELDDTSEYYEGYHIESRKWNGWATPSFEKPIADIIANKASTTDYRIEYSEKNDCYYAIEKENGKETVGYGHIINTKEGQKKVYCLGAGYWTWTAYTIDKVKEDVNAKIIENESSIDIEY